jgi:murein DD-endopeptidase MepM/ murein hydrolase activator NlpD
MAKKRKPSKHKPSPWLHRMQFRYRVSVLNEKTLEESWHLRLSRFGIILYASALLLVTFVLLALLVVFTPIRYYLPGYMGNDNRTNIIETSMYVDSLAQSVKLQEQYINIIREIASGEITPDSASGMSDSVGLAQAAQNLLENSEIEKQFTENYEQTEKYNLQTAANTAGTDTRIFYRPVKGIISSVFEPNENRNGISVATSLNELVTCIQEGTVVYSAFTFDFGWVIQVQHPDNYISIYKNNTSLLKKAGDAVKAGEAIAVTGQNQKETGLSDLFYFELWQRGKAVNPEDLIIF